MYVVGVGITSDSYNTYGHRYWVNTTVTSPTGRYASGSSSTSSSYARVDVYLDWNFEFGDFTVNTTHSMTCPYIYGVVSQCVKYATVCVGPYNLPQWCN